MEHFENMSHRVTNPGRAKGGFIFCLNAKHKKKRRRNATRHVEALCFVEPTVLSCPLIPVHICLHPVSSVGSGCDENNNNNNKNTCQADMTVPLNRGTAHLVLFAFDTIARTSLRGKKKQRWHASSRDAELDFVAWKRALVQLGLWRAERQEVTMALRAAVRTVILDQTSSIECLCAAWCIGLLPSLPHNTCRVSLECKDPSRLLRACLYANQPRLSFYARLILACGLLPQPEAAMICATDPAEWHELLPQYIRQTYRAMGEWRGAVASSASKEEAEDKTDEDADVDAPKAATRAIVDLFLFVRAWNQEHRAEAKRPLPPPALVVPFSRGATCERWLEVTWFPSHDAEFGKNLVAFLRANHWCLAGDRLRGMQRQADTEASVDASTTAVTWCSPATTGLQVTLTTVPQAPAATATLDEIASGGASTGSNVDSPHPVNHVFFDGSRFMCRMPYLIRAAQQHQDGEASSVASDGASPVSAAVTHSGLVRSRCASFFLFTVLVLGVSLARTTFWQRLRPTFA